MNEIVAQIKELMVAHGSSDNEYSRGVYNGLEHLLSKIEGRDPEFMMPLMDRKKK